MNKRLFISGSKHTNLVLTVNHNKQGITQTSNKTQTEIIIGGWKISYKQCKLDFWRISLTHCSVNIIWQYRFRICKCTQHQAPDQCLWLLLHWSVENLCSAAASRENNIFIRMQQNLTIQNISIEMLVRWTHFSILLTIPNVHMGNIAVSCVAVNISKNQVLWHYSAQICPETFGFLKQVLNGLSQHQPYNCWDH